MDSGSEHAPGFGFLHAILTTGRSLKNHGFDEEVGRMFDVCAEALDLPLEEKMKFEQGDNGDSFGLVSPSDIRTWNSQWYLKL